MTVAFDLDMTLVDSRPVSRSALDLLVTTYRADLDVDALMASYGLPLSRWLPAGVDVALFRHLQLQVAATAAPMPGACEAVAAVRRTGSRVVVITAAPDEVATRMLAGAGIAPDALRTNAWGFEKVAPLRAEHCCAFVGDHPDDMTAARQAGVIAVGVATGPVPPVGADVTLTALTAFSSWFTDHRRGEAAASRTPATTAS
jgi:phosphoglycolate phosphatase-like HAD superfamily hydrolase